MTQQVTHAQRSSTHLTGSPGIGADSADLKRKLKLTWEIAPARPTAPSPQPLAPPGDVRLWGAGGGGAVPTSACGSGKVGLEMAEMELF